MVEQKMWTTLEIKYLKENAEYDKNNAITNLLEISLNLDRSCSSVRGKVTRLRQDGLMPLYAGKKKSSYHQWTNREVEFLKKSIKREKSGRVSNLKQLSGWLNMNSDNIRMKIYSLEKRGEIPGAKRNYCEMHNITLSKRSISIITHGYKSNMTNKEIGEVLGRSEYAINQAAYRLKKSGMLNVSKRQRFTEDDVNYLINNIKLDQNGYVCNYDQLRKHLKRPHSSIVSKLTKLRIDGYIEKTADKTKGSVEGKRNMNRFNDMRFAKYKCGKRKEYAKN